VVLALTDSDQAALRGEFGPGRALAMRVVTRVANAMGATDLLDITGAHIDSCLDHGQAGIDFAAKLAEGGSLVRVPTTLNVASLDLLHPELYRGSQETAVRARRLMQYYQDMGCQPTWTCAPYQLSVRPAFGTHIAWAESNAIVFVNSVLGARTHRYGDFIDICAAITGRAPAAGLHLDENRVAEVIVDVTGLPPHLFDIEVFYQVLGHLMGSRVRSRVPVIVGLPPGVSEDRLKAIGAAAASSGSVGMFHCVGSTPEAPDLVTAGGGRIPRQRIAVNTEMVRDARDDLSTSTSTELGIVSLGTPHYSVTEFERLVNLLDGRPIHRSVDCYVSTGREVLTTIQQCGWVDQLEKAGVQLVTDTCTYVTPVMAERSGVAMTDSAKWAYYAPGNIGVEVVFGATSDCVASAVAGRVVRDESVWGPS
jgi:predicted aconitase